MASLTRSDLDFVLNQILLAEEHAAGGDLVSLAPDVFAPFGLRTVDGTLNNLLRDQGQFGASDQRFRQLLPQVWRDAEGNPNAGNIPTTYWSSSGSVYDSQPRVISNLVADQSTTNPAATAAINATPGAQLTTSPGLDGRFGTPDDSQTYFIPNVAPDGGLSAPFNSWFTLFGQFFDHGLDLINKGGNGTVRMLLAFDDPLYQRGADNVAGTADDLGADMIQGTFDDPFANFMTLTRASMVTDDNETPFDPTDDIHYHTNQTTPFIDQNQTYTSHPSHQVFLREYALNANGKPVATGRLFDGASGGLPTWAEVKAQAATKLGIQLDDADILNIPLIRTDAYGKFIPGANGYAQLVTGLGADGIPNTADDLVVEGDPTANGGLGVSTAGALRINHAFLDDIAHNAAPGTLYDTDGNPATQGTSTVEADADSIAGNAIATDYMGRKVAYDDELLDAHFITGDGRGNENIGLTAVHHVFHSEHNRQAAEIQSTLLADALASNDPTFLNQWLITDVTAGAIPNDPASLDWDGERLFQAARFATEMQYQHLVFEEFARKVQPNIDAFLTPIGYDVTIDPAITSEFANVVYRFGHSMLTETVDRYDPDFNAIGNPNGLDPAGQQMGLIAAFLNPLAFNQDGMNAEEAAGAIVRGMTRQVGNETDEFVTEALRNNLVGLPLDLAAINIARGRETGVPSLNDARQEFYRLTQDAQLKPYESWTDFAANLKHEASVINFIAAYGTHASITAADTVAEKRAAAELLVLGGAGAPADRLDFLNGPQDVTGVDAIDFWIGGLAEKQMPFGGLLGSTFAFVFETQLEALQNGDRFYYLSRTAGLDFGIALENNSFAQLIMLNTDATHLPGDVFTTPAFTLEVDLARQFNANVTNNPGSDSILFDDPLTVLDESADNIATPRQDPLGPDTLIPLVIRDDAQTPHVDTNYLRYTGADHVVLGGTAGNDKIISSIGDDTLYGDGGDDRLEGGAGNDRIFGGAGDDIITDAAGDDIIHGDEGHDVIHGGNGLNLLFGEAGQDFIITGEDLTSAFAGAGNDFVLGAPLSLGVVGGAGDDWLEFGHQGGSFGDTADPTGRDLTNGHDVFVGGPGFEDISGEGGDDIMFGSDGQEKMSGASGFDWANYKFETSGVTADMLLQIDRSTPATPSTSTLLDLFSFVEGLSGSAFADVLRGTDAVFTDFAIAGAQGSVFDAAGIARIAGLQDMLGAGVTSFGGGNIILGGAGSDIIEGRGGDDIIDGDRWLDVRVSVRDAANHAVEIRSVDSIRALIPDMLSGAIDPGQLEIVREIKSAPGPDYDTAMFSGERANYTVAIAFDGTVTVTDDFGTRFTRDGTDTLRGIERLQFADIAIDLPGGPSNAAPVGQLTISDATPAVNQILSVSALGVTDADIAGGSIAGRPVTFYWQVERPGVAGAPGTYWEDIVLPNSLGGGATAAQGATLQLPALSDGLPIEGAHIRVRAVYQDDRGVLENVFSAASAPVAAAAPVSASVTVPAESPTQSDGVHFIRSDLEFILDQIVIAERHAAGEDLLSLVGNERLAYGLRTVDGSFNNLVTGRSEFGASDNNFPLLLDQVFRNDLDGDSLDTNGPAPGGVISNTNYATTTNVADADPRIISNLIADQTESNPAALAAKEANPFGGLTISPGLDGVFGTADDQPVFEIPNVKPDARVSAPFNSWMTIFGQFFDHGLDLLDKGGSGTVYIPLQADDPLIAGNDGVFGTGDDLPESQRFMVLTRATNTAVQAGADGVLSTADDVHFHNNETTPFIDQNQTYTSHASHQAFLREYVRIDDQSINTGRLLEGSTGGLATWHDIKEQARDLLGIRLTDTDIFDVPLLATDAYGNIVLGPNGYAQIVTTHGLIEGVAGGLDLNSLPGGATVGRTHHAFLDDIAHNAVPGTVYDTDGNPATQATSIVQGDADSVAGNAIATDYRGRKVAYDDELLDAHFITGDGRGNENIGLTAVHQIFHAEHNRLVEHTKVVALASNDFAFLNEWLRVDVASMPVTPGEIAALQWDGARLFQAARFGAEMQYQHLVFEEFARTVQPQVDPFVPGQSYDTTLNPAIYAEFAHVVYRFGHSMLTETVDRYDPGFNVVDADPLHAGQTGSGHQLGLIAAFLNPLAFAASGDDASEAAGAIVRGMTRQVSNEIDEFVTEALRNNLVGLPLDLAAVNLARGRDTGVPTLNQARGEIFEMTGDAQLAPYTSWLDFAAHLKHPESVVNFIAAYGTHSTITSADTLAGKRVAAAAIVLGEAGAPTDRLAFLNGPAASTGLNSVDFWIGGLAESQMPFGGLLGSTFNFVFENQMERLQAGDRFYYLERTAGLNFFTELEGNSFARLIMANTDAQHLPADVFTTPRFTLEVDAARQFNEGVLAGPDGIVTDNPNTVIDESADNLPGAADPTGDGASLIPLVIRDDPDTPGADTNYLRYTGVDHVVLGGTDPGNAANPSGDDILICGDGDDTLYGDGGNDVLDGGNGADTILGGAGDDIITDSGGDDVLQGDAGNDAIQGGNGLNLILGGFGNDLVISGEDASTVFGGPGQDFILGTRANAQVMGNEGDDWLERGNADGASGDNGDPYARDQVIGNDVYIGDNVVDIMNAEGGDDIMVGNGGQQDHYLGGSGFDWAVYKDSPGGVVVFAELLFENEAIALGANPSTLDRFQSIEGVSGSQQDDFIIGANRPTAFYATSGVTGSVLTNFDLITGLRALVESFDPAATSFTGEILLGGAGSDIIKGGWGNEIIDADAWLNVQIAVYDAFDTTHAGPPIDVSDSMTEFQDQIFRDDLSISQLGIVREIRHTLLDDEEPTAGLGYDTVSFDGNRGDYIIDNLVVDNNGTVADLTDDIVRVARVTHFVNGVVGADGVDVVHNAERLEFADQIVVLNPNSPNQAPQNLLTIDDATPTESQLLSVSSAGVTDADNITLANPTGQISGGTYYWQAKAPGGVFTDVLVNDGITTRPVTGTTFVPTDFQVGTELRVRAVYTDANGIVETIFSAPTAFVAGVNDPHTGIVLINDTTSTQNQALVALVALNEIDQPLPPNVGEIPPAIALDYQWQRSTDGGATWSDIPGATTPGYVPDAADVYATVANPDTLVRVRVSYVDGQGFHEEAFSQPTTRIGRHLGGDNAANVLTDGTPYQDWMQGFDGHDVLVGLAGDDLLEGGAGDDTIAGGADNDTLFGLTGDDLLLGEAGDDVLMGDEGDDTLDGGAGADSLSGGVGNDIYVVSDETDYVVENPGEGIDLARTTLNAYILGSNLENLTYIGSTGNFVGTGNALDNLLTGGDGDDILSGLFGNDILNGGAGDDALLGGANDDTINGGRGNDILQGEAGNDTLLYSVGDDADTIDGGADIDTLRIAGGLAADKLDVIYNGSRLIAFESGLIANVELIEADLAGDIDTLSYAGSGAAISVDLRSGSASGFSSIANVENVTGGGGHDALTGNGTANLLIGGAGNDALDGEGGTDIAVFSGPRSAYTITRAGMITTVRGPDGTDTLSDIERLQFADASLAARPVTDDFNSDGRSDLVWRGPAGQVETWLAQGAGAPVKLADGVPPQSWSIVDTHGDYNGDGRSDILWRNSDGMIATWLMNGDGTHGAGLSTAVDPNWTLIDGHADYNGDGRSDLLWRAPNGEVRSWLINGSTLASQLSHGTVPMSWSIVDTHGDYNADGRSDVVWRNSDGTIATWLMNGTAPHTFGLIAPMTASWTLLDGHGDYNGDGKSDLLWRAANGEVRTWLINNGTLASEVSHGTVPTSWSIVDAHGDYNADGRTDILWRNADGTIATWLMNGTAPHVFGLITPMAASSTLIDGHSDYNGDGKSDLLWRAADGEVRAWLINNSTLVSQVTYGTLPLNWNIAEETAPAQVGDAGNNVLTGTVGANLLRGLGGADTLSGNGGGDRFLFDTPLGTSNVDTVVDFKSGQDKLVLSDVIFTTLAAGPLSAAQWVVGPGAQAQDANDRILYNTASGQLSYDADGSGAGAARAFATLFGTPSLAATDILVQGDGPAGPRAITNDLNADGRSDLVWRGPAGQVETWLAQGAGAPVKLADGVPPQSWSIVDTHGDYNGDGRSDILWRNSDGMIATWLMNGDGTHGAGLSTAVDPNWTLIDGHADYNGDGRSDLLWRAPNGEVRSWLINGSTLASQLSHGTVPMSWSIVDTHGDYNADGRSDVVWRNSDGTIATWLMNGTAPHTFGLIAPMTASWTLLDGHGDYNGDGKSDLLWRAANGEVRTWLINNGTLASEVSHGTVPTSWSIVDAHGDYNADGRTDILWRNADGTIATWLMNGTAPHVFGLITPMAASSTLIDGHSDYNGDGKSDLLWRAADGEVRAWLIDNSTLVSQVTYGTLPLNWNIAEETAPAQVGDAGNNVLTGTVGANLLRGLGGTDTLSGNGGGDRFLFDTPLGASNVDTVVDFKSGQDKLVLSDVIFTNLAAGPLSAAQWVVGPGAQAQDANDRILYNTASGQLSYDADGSGAGAARAFATLFGTPSLNASDVFVCVG